MPYICLSFAECLGALSQRRSIAAWKCGTSGTWNPVVPACTATCMRSQSIQHTSGEILVGSLFILQYCRICLSLHFKHCLWGSLNENIDNNNNFLMIFLFLQGCFRNYFPVFLLVALMGDGCWQLTSTAKWEYILAQASRSAELSHILTDNSSI